MRTSWMVCFFGLLAACSSSSNDAAPAPTDPGVAVPADKVCADGFAPLDGGAGCAPVITTQTCKPGTRATIASATCVPVGVVSCPAGFARDATGWGCDAVLPSTACAIGSGTRERLGTTTCVAVSDCNAAFPPAGASIFVDAAFTDPQLDATHFRTIADAVAAAPAGATIAIESGTYVEQVVLAHRKVSLVGRCAEKVVMKQVDGVIGSGIELSRGDDAHLQNITLRGYNAAISALGGKGTLDSIVVEDGLLAGVVAGNVGTDLSLTNVVVRGMKVRSNGNQAFGVFASAGANMTVTDSVLSANEFVNVGVTAADTTMSVSRSIVREGKPFGLQGLYGMGIYAAQGGSITVEETAIVDNSSAGIDVFSDAMGKSSAILRRSVIRRTKRDPGKKNARGIELTGADLVVEQSTIGGSAEFELIATAGSTANISDSTFLGAVPTAPERGAVGLFIDASTTKAHSVAIVSARAGVELQGAGKLDMDASLVDATLTAPTYYEDGHWIGLGIAAGTKSTLTLASSTVQDVHTIGILVTGTANVTDTLVRGTRAGPDGLGGRGFCVQNGGTATVARSGFVNNAEAGVIVQLGGATLTMTTSMVKDTVLDHDGHFGIGVLLGGDATGSIDTSTITTSSGIGLAVAAAGAFVHHTTISKNAVGVHTQDGTSLMTGEMVGDPLSLVVSNDTRFVDNATRVGSGIVPLPSVLDPKKP